MCVMNTAENDKEIDFANYAERTKGFSNAMDAVSGVQYSNKFLVPKKQMLVLELMK